MDAIENDIKGLGLLKEPLVRTSPGEKDIVR